MKNKKYDFTDISLDDFQDFLFDRPITKPKNEGEPWDWDWNEKIKYDDSHLTKLYIELFKNSRNLLTKYSKDQLDRGFWAVSEEILDFSTHNLIWNSELEMSQIEELIKSMFFVYEQLFELAPLESACYMWWDRLAFNFYGGDPLNPINNERDRHIQNAMLVTLEKILNLESEACQLAALHGLGHLMHPDSKQAIDDYIKIKNPSAEIKQYAKACITGEIM